MELLYPHSPSIPEREGRDAPIVSHLKSKWVLYFFSRNPHGVFALGCCTTMHNTKSILLQYFKKKKTFIIHRENTWQHSPSSLLKRAQKPVVCSPAVFLQSIAPGDLVQKTWLRCPMNPVAITAQ